MKKLNHELKPSEKKSAKSAAKVHPTPPCSDENSTIILPDKKPQNN